MSIKLKQSFVQSADTIRPCHWASDTSVPDPAASSAAGEELTGAKGNEAAEFVLTAVEVGTGNQRKVGANTMAIKWADAADDGGGGGGDDGAAAGEPERGERNRGSSGSGSTRLGKGRAGKRKSKTGEASAASDSSKGAATMKWSTLSSPTTMARMLAVICCLKTIRERRSDTLKCC